MQHGRMCAALDAVSLCTVGLLPGLLQDLVQEHNQGCAYLTL